MSLWLIIGLGGFVGAILRYWISGWIQSGFLTFPLGTLGVNFIGSLLLALDNVCLGIPRTIRRRGPNISDHWRLGLFHYHVRLSALNL